MRRVIIESPYAGDIQRNTGYARRAMWDCLHRGEAPLASHLLYTQVLDDATYDDRELGLHAGWAWQDVADVTVVYTDLGISDGMRRAIELAHEHGRPVEYREIGL